MKLRHPALIRAAARAGAGLLRCWLGTLRYHYCPLGPDVDPSRTGFAGQYLYAFWHETLLLPAYRFGGGTNFYALIGQHADGELIAQVCRHLGFRVVRGSTTRGGVAAVREILKMSCPFQLGVTPDGPRGPRRQVQPGLVYLASRLGVPVVPTGFAYERPWRADSWDRFALPRPFTRATCVTAEPMLVPPDADRVTLERHRLQIEGVMLSVTEAAECWAEDRVKPAAMAAPPAPSVPPLAA